MQKMQKLRQRIPIYYFFLINTTDNISVLRCSTNICKDIINVRGHALLRKKVFRPTQILKKWCQVRSAHRNSRVSLKILQRNDKKNYFKMLFMSLKSHFTTVQKLKSI